jgi:Ca2+-binding EF-hand superfamily protein
MAHGAPPKAKGKSMNRGASASFTSDFSQMGKSGTSVLSGTSNILDEEKRLIEKVFSIVDKDNSGSIDHAELEDMFKLFGVETHFLSAAIQRIMSNVDKDHDGTISPQEFYKLLSQKFEKGDPRKDIDQVFDNMDTKKDKLLDVEELHAVATTLGESLEKKEIKDMLSTFKTMYEEGASKDKKKDKDKTPDDKKSVTTESENLKLTMDEWYFIMTQEL